MLMRNVQNNWNSDIRGIFFPFALMDGLNFKGNEVKAREIAKCDELGPKTFIF